MLLWATASAVAMALWRGPIGFSNGPEEARIVATAFLFVTGFFAWSFAKSVRRNSRERAAHRTTVYALTDRRALRLDSAAETDTIVELSELASGEAACERRGGYVMLVRPDGTYALTFEGVGTEEGPIRDALAAARKPK